MLVVFLTVISSVLVFVISEYLKEIWLTPLQNYKKLKSRILFALTMYARYFANSYVSEKDDLYQNYKTASDEIRMLGSELKAFIELLYPIRIGIPNGQVLNEISFQLIGLSNNMMIPEDSTGRPIKNLSNRDRIIELLKKEEI